MAEQRTFTAAEIKEMVEDCTDSWGNLYRISFLNRLDREAEEPTDV